MSQWFHIKFLKTSFLLSAQNDLLCVVSVLRETSKRPSVFTPWPSVALKGFYNTSELWWFQPITTVNEIQNQQRDFIFYFFKLLNSKLRFWPLLLAGQNLFEEGHNICAFSKTLHWPWVLSGLRNSHFLCMSMYRMSMVALFSPLRFSWHFLEQPHSKWGQGWRYVHTCTKLTLPGTTRANEVKAGHMHTHVLSWHFLEQPYSKWGHGWTHAYTCTKLTLLWKAEHVHTHALRWHFLEQQEQMRSQLDTCILILRWHFLKQPYSKWGQGWRCAYTCATLALPGATQANEVTDGHVHTHVLSWHFLE